MREDKDTIKLLYTHISPFILCEEIVRMLQAMPSDDPLMVLWEKACDSNLSSDAIEFLKALADEVISELVHDYRLNNMKHPTQLWIDDGDGL